MAIYITLNQEFTEMTWKRKDHCTPPLAERTGATRFHSPSQYILLTKLEKTVCWGKCIHMIATIHMFFFKYIFECKVIQYRIVFIIRLARFCPTVFPLEEQLGLNLTKRTPGMLSCLGPRCDLHSFFFYLVHQDFYDPRLTDESWIDDPLLMIARSG